MSALIFILKKTARNIKATGFPVLDKICWHFTQEGGLLVDHSILVSKYVFKKKKNLIDAFQFQILAINRSKRKGGFWEKEITWFCSLNILHKQRAKEKLHKNSFFLVYSSCVKGTEHHHRDSVEAPWGKSGFFLFSCSKWGVTINVFSRVQAALCQRLY